MQKILTSKNQRASMRALSAVCANLASGWFALVVIAPNFWPLTGWREAVVLTQDVVLGTVFLLFTIILERKSL